jgi:hypothetical protein
MITMIMTCLIGVAVLMVSAALSGSAWAWADDPKPETNNARMDVQAMVLARHFLLSLRYTLSSRD